MKATVKIYFFNATKDVKIKNPRGSDPFWVQKFDQIRIAIPNCKCLEQPKKRLGDYCYYMGKTYYLEILRGCHDTTPLCVEFCNW